MLMGGFTAQEVKDILEVRELKKKLKEEQKKTDESFKRVEKKVGKLVDLDGESKGKPRRRT
jgi:hypothetical protein